MSDINSIVYIMLLIIVMLLIVFTSYYYYTVQTWMTLMYVAHRCCITLQAEFDDLDNYLENDNTKYDEQDGFVGDEDVTNRGVNLISGLNKMTLSTLQTGMPSQ